LIFTESKLYKRFKLFLFVKLGEEVMC